jgi:hypothetical protein
MKRATKAAVVCITVVGVVAFLFFVPTVPAEYPHSPTHITPCLPLVPFTCGRVDVQGSITYFVFGYGGIIKPTYNYPQIDHIYQILW